MNAIILIITVLVAMFCFKYTKHDGWKCTNCGQEHGYWTGKCQCGEVRIINNET